MRDPQVIALIAKATEGARIDLLRHKNADEGYTCHSIGISGGCGEHCPVFLAHDCEHGKPTTEGQP
jgi:hypothetical protein